MGAGPAGQPVAQAPTGGAFPLPGTGTGTGAIPGLGAPNPLMQGLPLPPEALAGGQPQTPEAAAVDKLVSVQAGANHMAAGAAGGSGSNAGGTTVTAGRGEVPGPIAGQTGAAGPVAATPQTAAAPPPYVPPSGPTPAAQVGNQPVEVPGESVFQPPGFSHAYHFNEFSPADQKQAETAYAKALSVFNTSKLSDAERIELARIVGSRPPHIRTIADLDALNRATSELSVLGAGHGAAVYRVDEMAKRAGPDDDKAIRTALQFISKMHDTESPEAKQRIRDYVSSVDGGRIAYLADTFAEGDLGNLDVEKLLQRNVHDIYSPSFAKLDPASQHAAIQNTLEFAQRFHREVELPEAVYLQMTPAERDRAAQGWARVRIARDQQQTGAAGLKLREARFYAEMDGLLGGHGAGRAGGLTPNAQLLAARYPLDQAIKKLAAARRVKANDFYHGKYDEAKTNIMRDLAAVDPQADQHQQEIEIAAVRQIIKNPATNKINQPFAQLDLNVLLGMQHYQTEAARLAQTAGDGQGTGTGLPEVPPAPGQAAAPTAPHGGVWAILPGLGRKYIDPDRYARALFDHKKAGSLAEAQRLVKGYVQQSKQVKIRAR